MSGATTSGSSGSCPLEPARTYQACTGGRRAGPPEDCGGPWAFLEQRQRHSLVALMGRLAEIAEEADLLEDRREELIEMRRWLTLDRFDRRAVNRALAAVAASHTSAA